MLEEVKNYYGNTLQKSEDLQTNACCTGAAPPEFMKTVLAKIHDEVASRYYGCGLVMPEKLEGCHILDLGCGAGRDVYTLSAFVGEHGSVTGVDMTEQQLAVATAHRDYHAEAFGYAQPNTHFVLGELEKLAELGLPENHYDVIVSNCVINLCVDKMAVLKAANKLLKRGGELYFSDVYASRRVPEHLQRDEVLYGECLSGAYYWNDFINAAKAAGFLDPRLVESSPITIENDALAERVHGIEFYSATYRLFKLPELEPACEDYGQAVIYRGGIAHNEHAFALDGHHYIEKGRVFPVCGNTDSMLRETRFKEHFEFIGDRSTHFGIFEGCGSELPFAETHFENTGGGSCC